MTIHVVLAVVALALALAAFARGARLVARALRDTDDPESSLWLIRGIRGVVLAASAVGLALGLLTSSTGVIVVALVFLAEELYETGVVALVLRAARVVVSP